MLKPRYLLSAAVLLLLAWMLNPDAEQHRQHIKTVVAQRSQLENFLGLGDLTAFASSYHSLGLFFLYQS